MATIVTRAGKGSALTHTEVDANFTNLNTDKVESSALATVATTGAYSDLTGTPTLATVATTGAYSDLSGTPTLATVATTGAYSDLSGTPTIPTDFVSAASGGTFTGNVDFSAGIDVTGNVTVTGTVDGRDIATNIPSSLGTAGQVLAVNTGATATEWVDASGGGGGTIEVTASGAIANGDLVSLNSDGTVSVTGGFGLTPVTYNSNSTEGNTAVYDTSNDKVVVAYRDNSDSYGKAVVGTVSGTSISFGTPVNFLTSNAESVHATFDSTNNKVVITYYDPNDSYYGKAVVGTVSGTSISFGSTATFASANVRYPKVAFDSNAGKVVVAYRDLSNSNYGTAVVGTVSGTSISFGTPVVFLSKNPTNWTFPVFDSNSNKMVILCKDGSGKAVVGTVSGTSISFGSEATFQGATVEDVTGTFDSDNNKVIAIWHYTSGQGAAAVGTVSGTSISFGSATTFETNSINLPNAAYDPVANVVGVAYRDQTVLKSKYVSLTVSGTSITAADPVILIDENSAHNGLLYDPDGEVFVHTAQVQSDTTAKGQIYNASANINNWVGIATAAVSDTSTGTFTVVSGVNEGQSGLTVGARYYISNTGVLSTTENTGYEIGKALSATKLLITHGSVG